ncbi:uncharacterized protein LOC129790040 [Lutzomyia longipalpis]|uniref:uncharacterized protein LOC129790040 n=1 Tax=Lutzomyia longipalpis TaxID=7200 RepID=UPI00248427FA|nr:uncharacterized protein LOC129790040 [Lutzomyia longipalpis]
MELTGKTNKNKPKLKIINFVFYDIASTLLIACGAIVAISSCDAAKSTTERTLLVVQEAPEKAQVADGSTQRVLTKRGGVNFGGVLGGWNTADWQNAWTQPWNAQSFGSQTFGASISQPWFGSHKYVPSPAEVTAAIAAAKQASANVLVAQQQVLAAKENVLSQQKLAAERETQASIAQQKSEAAAAIQRSEAAAAAQAVILAQQRLASAKAAVAHHQKIAAAKEAQAASALQSSAHAAAAEIQRTEHEASKLSTYQRNDAAAALHHVTATKDAAVAPLTIGNNRLPTVTFTPYHYPAASWSPGFVTSATPSLAAYSSGGPWSSALLPHRTGLGLWG